MAWISVLLGVIAILAVFINLASFTELYKIQDSAPKQLVAVELHILYSMLIFSVAYFCLKMVDAFKKQSIEVVSPPVREIRSNQDDYSAKPRGNVHFNISDWAVSDDSKRLLSENDESYIVRKYLRSEGGKYFAGPTQFMSYEDARKTIISRWKHENGL